MEIREFDGTRGDAQGVIAVDGETFGDCRYTPQTISELVKAGGQRVWVAEAEGNVVGFVSAFATHSLAGDRWEIDELAVRPSAQGRGIGTALVSHALLGTPPALPARTVVAVSNVASQRAFAKNGFSPAAERHLLVRRAAQPLSPTRASAIPVRRATSADAWALARLSRQTVERARSCLAQADNVYLIAGADQGYVELLQVRTLQYMGFWLEAMQLAAQDPQAIDALLATAVEWVDAAGQAGEADLVGYLAWPEVRAVYEGCLEHGFVRIGQYQPWMIDRILD